MSAIVEVADSASRVTKVDVAKIEMSGAAGEPVAAGAQWIDCAREWPAVDWIGRGSIAMDLVNTVAALSGPGGLVATGTAAADSADIA